MSVTKGAKTTGAYTYSSLRTETPQARTPYTSPRNYGELLERFSGCVAPVMDLDYDLYCAFHTREILERKIRLLAECGFRRIYIVAPPPGNPDYSIRVAPQDGPPNFLRQSRAALGDDPLRLAVDFAKHAGLKVFIIIKPYEGGGAYTIPHGKEPPCNRNWMETLGGRAVGLDPFIIEHPEFLVARKPCEELRSLDADRIELVFVPDHLDGRRTGTTSHSGSEEQVITAYPAVDFRVYTSTDNGAYKLYRDDFKVSQRIERRMVRDANGQPVFPKPVPCRIIELSGLKLQSPYFAVSFSGDEKAFRTIPYSMFRVFAGQQELPVTVTPSVRDSVLTGKSHFTENGFEFEKAGPYYWDCGWYSGCLFAFARGKTKAIRGCLCEAYPEVRSHWFKQVKSFVEMGCDGVDIRLDNHGSSMTDFVNYGFNPPLVQAYKERYGVDILKQSPDPIKMMKLRGEFFELFVRQVAAFLHQRGLTVQMHLKDCYEHPTIDPTFHSAGFWCEPKVVPDWRRAVEIVDEITIKDYYFGKYDPNKASGIKDLASAAGKPLWVHCYLQQGHELTDEFVEAVKADPRVTGLLLYEVVWNRQENDGIVRVDPDGRVSLVL